MNTAETGFNTIVEAAMQSLVSEWSFLNKLTKKKKKTEHKDG